MGAIRPITEAERPFLLELGAELRRLRHDAGLSQAELAHLVGVTRHHVAHIEAGSVRTRRSTLTVVAGFLVEPADVAALVDRLVALAGPALGKELADPAKYERARRQREARRAREDQRVLRAARRLAQQWVRFHDRHGHWPQERYER